MKKWVLLIFLISCEMIPQGAHPVGDNAEITISGATGTINAPVTLTIRSTVKLTNLLANKFEVDNCTLSAFTQITRQYFTVLATPTAEGTVTISLPAGCCLTPGGKTNLASNEINVFYTEGGGESEEDTIYDEWVANRGYKGTTTVKVGTWTGYRFSRILAPVSSSNIIPPSGAIQPIDGTNDAFNLSTVSNPGITGSLTMAFLIKKTSAPSGTVTLFDTNTNVPRCKFLLRISAGNTHMGISYNGTVHDCGAAFDYDTDFHVLVFAVDGVNNVGAIWLDGVQQGSDFTLTGGGLNANTGQNLVFFKSASAGSEYFGGSIMKVRAYTNYVSDTNIGNLSSGDFPNAITDNTPLIFLAGLGQSNNAPPNIGAAYAPENNTLANYPSELRGTITGVQYWNGVSKSNVWLQLTGTSTSGSTGLSGGPGHILKEAYDLTVRHPTYDIRVMRDFKGATGFVDNYWTVSTPGSTYNTSIRGKIADAYFNLVTIEQRNMVGFYVTWNQWEKEAHDTEANALLWQGWVQDLIDDLKSITTNDMVFIMIGANTRSDADWKDIIIDAQDALVASDPTHIKKVDTEDITYFPYLGGLVHYGVTGEINIGSNIRGTVQFM